jgi:hypothetical protein
VAAKSAGNSSFVNSQWPTHFMNRYVSLYMKRVNYDTRTHNVGAKLTVILLHGDLFYWRYHYAAVVHIAISVSRLITCCAEPSNVRVIDENMQLTLLSDRIVSETSVETLRMAQTRGTPLPTCARQLSPRGQVARRSPPFQYHSSGPRSQRSLWSQYVRRGRLLRYV